MEITRLERENNDLKRLLNLEKKKHAEARLNNKLMANSLSVTLSNIESQKAVLKTALDMNQQMETDDSTNECSNVYETGWI